MKFEQNIEEKLAQLKPHLPQGTEVEFELIDDVVYRVSIHAPGIDINTSIMISVRASRFFGSSYINGRGEGNFIIINIKKRICSPAEIIIISNFLEHFIEDKIYN